ncbi:hypothetical protein J5N97_030219 [Dioscorea zingiberensis]|uniref:Uncharacterized protein n=1 Tax=Dioscorea zingiberensis TaxID=325984 RepID=A0A9D5BX30_9LILI|nr:hypothetical protein J5N97_030219 [Dioscorea zingiberensis]
MNLFQLSSPPHRTVVVVCGCAIATASLQLAITIGYRNLAVVAGSSSPAATACCCCVIAAAEHWKLLNVMQIPMSLISNAVVESCVGSLSFLIVMDISYSLNINSKSIKSFVNNCKCLIHLRRNIPPTPPEIKFNHGNHTVSQVDEEVAMVVANTMPKLEQLELANSRFSDHGLGAILTNYKALCILDITGCWNVRMDGDVGLRCDSIENFMNLWYHYYEYDYLSFSADEGRNKESDDSDDDYGV